MLRHRDGAGGVRRLGGVLPPAVLAPHERPLHPDTPTVHVHVAHPQRHEFLGPQPAIPADPHEQVVPRGPGECCGERFDLGGGEELGSELLRVLHPRKLGARRRVARSEPVPHGVARNTLFAAMNAWPLSTASEGVCAEAELSRSS